jgi:hypothetical protein
MAERQWAVVRYPSRERPAISGALRDQARWVYERQAEDDGRFAAARAAVRDALQPDGALVGMTCDRRFVVLFENWAASCDEAGIDRRSSTLVFPTDAVADERARALGFMTYFDPASELLADVGASAAYGDPEWTKHMFHQNWVIRQLLTFNAHVLFQDVDVVWRRDPVPWLAAKAESGTDISIMYDGPNDRFQPIYGNSGFMFFRNHDRVRRFWGEVFASHEMVGYYQSQQEPLNVLLGVHVHRGLDVLVLDEERFANGHLYCGGRTPPPDPWVMHNSWTATLEDKLERYATNGLWFL